MLKNGRARGKHSNKAKKVAAMGPLMTRASNTFIVMFMYNTKNIRILINMKEKLHSRKREREGFTSCL